MSLESSVEEFTQRFAAHAASGVLYPQPEGHPLIEFAVQGLVLYLFDRSGPYAVRPGPGRVIVHGVASSLRALSSEDTAVKRAQSVGVSALEGTGEVKAVQRRALVVDVGFDLVLGLLSSRDSLEMQVGQTVAFETLAPLHGFVIDQE